MRKRLGLCDLTDSIDGILHGTEAEKQSLSMRYYKVANTTDQLRLLGMKGDSFTIRYGVITHHKSKDRSHDLSVSEWKELCSHITDPLFVNADETSFTLFLDIHREKQLMLVGVTVKQTGRNRFVNAIDTVFFTENLRRGGKTIYTKTKITVEQQALLDRLKFRQYPAVQND